MNPTTPLLTAAIITLSIILVSFCKLVSASAIPAPLESCRTYMGMVFGALVYQTLVYLYNKYRRLSMRYVLGLLALPAFCTTTIVSITPTSTQAIVAYTTNQTASTCTFRASEGGSLGTMVNDVNTSLFSGSNAATRTGAVAGSYFVLGTRGNFQASDSKWYSRALAAYQQHIVGLTCGADSEVTSTFTTSNIPWATPPEALQFDSSLFGNYAQPTIDYTDITKTYIDAHTGLKITRLTDASDAADASLANNTPGTPVDLASAWTTISNITGTGSFASYGGAATSGAAIFLPMPVTGAYPPNALYDSIENIPVNSRININGYGSAASGADTTVSACLSSDSGSTCACPAIDLPAFPQGSGSAAVRSFPSSGYPSAHFAQWCTTQPVALSPPLIVAVSGVTTYGVKLWKKTATGTINLNTARYDSTYTTQPSIPTGGESANCSKNYADTTVDRNGSALGRTQHGYLCGFDDMFGNVNLYWLGTNGESRLISRLRVPAVSGSSGGKDDNGNVQGCITIGGVTPDSPFDATDPNSLYCIGFTSGTTYSVIRKFTYNSGTGGCGYKAYVVDYDLTHDNSCMTVTNITKASLNQDLTSLMVAALPSFKSSYFTAWSGGGPDGTGQISLVVKAAGQNTIGWFARFDIGTVAITQAVSSYNTYPAKWGNIHGGSGTEASYGTLYINPLTAASTLGVGQFTFNITAIQGLGSTDLTNSYTDASTCEILGVVNSGFIAGGATGNNCIKITIDTLDAFNPTPHATDRATFPHPKNSTACGGDNSTANCYSQIGNLEEGDYFVDGANGFGEIFRLVRKLSATSWIVQRGVLLPCGNSGKTSHTSWTPTLWVGNVCGSGQATFYWMASNGVITADNPNMNMGHHDILIPSGSSSGTYVQAAYDIRTGLLSAQIGQPATFSNTLQYGPKFNGSTAALNSNSIQSHMSCRQETAPPSELRWCLDGRPLGGAAGGAITLGYQVVTTCGTINTCTASNPVAANVYKVAHMTDTPGGAGNVLSTLDRKNLPVHAWAGKYLLADISGPGSSISAAANWSFCVADFAGECISGSSSGDVFEKVLSADTMGTALTSLDTNAPSWVSASPIIGFSTQVGIDRTDPTGTYWRDLTSFFQGLGWPNNYWNAHPTADGSLTWSVSRWLNGLGSELVAVILPPWPNVADTTNSAYVPVSIPVSGNAQPNARVKFGYVENGSPTSYFCTTRLEACVTDSVWDGTTSTTPFKWSSETQTLQACSPACLIKVPAMIGKVVYAVIEELDSTGTVQNTVAVNSFTVPFNDVQGSTARRISGQTRIYGGTR
jgi:hypothetical protein